MIENDKKYKKNFIDGFDVLVKEESPILDPIISRVKGEIYNLIKTDNMEGMPIKEIRNLHILNDCTHPDIFDIIYNYVY